MASLIQQKMHKIADLFRGTQERKLPSNSVIHNSKTLQVPADEDVSFDYAYKIEAVRDWLFGQVKA